MRKVSALERHETFTAFQHSVAVKLFLALFMNTGLTVIVVNARLQSVDVPSGLGIFSGTFTDFEPRWYAGTAQAPFAVMS